MTTEEAIVRLDESVPHPETGFPEDVFLLVSRLAPLINVDLLVQDSQKRTLLTWREDDFYGPGWHIPGGIIRYKEHAAERIRKCALEELGCRVGFDPEPLTIIETMDTRRNRGHFISMLYRCRLAGDPDATRRASGKPRPGDWEWHSRCPQQLLAIQQAYAQFFKSGD